MAGMIQLAAKGLQDQWLSGTPQTTFFQSKFVQYTPYLLRVREVPFKNSGAAFGTAQLCDISSAGDVVRSVTLRLTLPSLSSNPGYGLVYPEAIQNPTFWYLDANLFPFASYFGRNLRPFFTQIDTNWLPTVVTYGPSGFQFVNAPGTYTPAWIGFTDLKSALFWGFKNYQQVQTVQGIGTVYLWKFTGSAELTYYSSGWSTANSATFQQYPASAALTLIQSVELYIGGQLIESIPNSYISLVNDMTVKVEQQSSLSNLYQLPIVSTTSADCYIKVPFSLDKIPVCALTRQPLEILINVGPFSSVSPTTTPGTFPLAGTAVAAVTDDINDYVLTSTALTVYNQGNLIAMTPVTATTIVTDNSNIFLFNSTTAYQYAPSSNTLLSYQYGATTFSNVFCGFWSGSGWLYTGCNSVQLFPDGTTYNQTNYEFPFAGAYLASTWNGYAFIAVAIGIVVQSTTVQSQYQVYSTPWGAPTAMSSNYYVTANALVTWSGSAWSLVSSLSSAPTSVLATTYSVYVFSANQILVFTGSATPSAIPCFTVTTSCAGSGTTVYLGTSSNTCSWDTTGTTFTQISSAAPRLLFFYNSLFMFDNSSTCNVYDGSTTTPVNTGLTGPYTVFASTNRLYIASTAVSYYNGSFVRMTLPSTTYTLTTCKPVFDGQYIYTFTTSAVYKINTFTNFLDPASHYITTWVTNTPASAAFDGRFITVYPRSTSSTIVTIDTFLSITQTFGYSVSPLISANYTASTYQYVAGDAGVVYNPLSRTTNVSTFTISAGIGATNDSSNIYVFGSNLASNGISAYSIANNSNTIVQYPALIGKNTTTVQYLNSTYIVNPVSVIIFSPNGIPVVANSIAISGVSNAACMVGTNLYIFPGGAASKNYCIQIMSTTSPYTSSFIAAPAVDNYTSAIYDGTNIYASNGSAYYTINPTGDYFSDPTVWTTGSRTFGYNASAYASQVFSVTATNLYFANAVSFAATATISAPFQAVPVISRESPSSIYFVDKSNLYSYSGTGTIKGPTFLPAQRTAVDMTSTASTVYISWADGTFATLDTTANDVAYYTTQAPSPTIGAAVATALSGTTVFTVSGQYVSNVSGTLNKTYLSNSFADITVINSNIYAIPSNLFSSNALVIFDPALNQLYANAIPYSLTPSPIYGSKVVQGQTLYMFALNANLGVIMPTTGNTVAYTGAWTNGGTACSFLVNTTIYLTPANSPNVVAYDTTTGNYTNSSAALSLQPPIANIVTTYNTWFASQDAYGSLFGSVYQQPGLIPMFAGNFLAKNDGTLIIDTNSLTTYSFPTSSLYFNSAYLLGSNVYLANSTTSSVRVFSVSTGAAYNLTTIGQIKTIGATSIGTYLSNGASVQIQGIYTQNFATDSTISVPLADGSMLYGGSTISAVSPSLTQTFNYQSTWGVAAQNYSCVWTYGGYTYLAPASGNNVVQISSTSLSQVSSSYIQHYDVNKTVGLSSTYLVQISQDQFSNLLFVCGANIVRYNTLQPFTSAGSWSAVPTISVSSQASMYYGGKEYVFGSSSMVVTPIVGYTPAYSTYSFTSNIVSRVATQSGTSITMYPSIASSNIVTFNTATNTFTYQAHDQAVLAVANTATLTIAVNATKINVFSQGTSIGNYSFTNPSSKVYGALFDGRFLNVLAGSGTARFDTNNFSAGVTYSNVFLAMQQFGSNIFAANATVSSYLGFSPRPYTEVSYPSPVTGLVGGYGKQGSNLINYVTGTTLVTGLSTAAASDSLLLGSALYMLSSDVVLVYKNGTYTTIPKPIAYNQNIATDGTSIYINSDTGVMKISSTYQQSVVTLPINGIVSCYGGVYPYTADTLYYYVRVSNLTSYSTFGSNVTNTSLVKLYSMPLPFVFNTMTSTGPTPPQTITYGVITPGAQTANVLVLNSGIQLWTVPFSGQYTFIAGGASGGNSDLGTGGKGIVVSNTVTLTQGTMIRIVVGQQGSSYVGSAGTGACGGGGTFVTSNTNSAYLVAGGGGGANGSGGRTAIGTTHNGGNAVITTGAGGSGAIQGENSGGGGAGILENFTNVLASFSTLVYAFSNIYANVTTNGQKVTSGSVPGGNLSFLGGGFGCGGPSDYTGLGGGGGGGYTGGRPGAVTTTTSNALSYPPNSGATISSLPAFTGTSPGPFTTTLSGAAYGNGTYTVNASSAYPGLGGLDVTNMYHPRSDGTCWWSSANTSYDGQDGNSGLYVGPTTPQFTYTATNGISYYGEWISITLPSSVILSSHTIYCNPNYGQFPAGFVVLGSNDGTTWVLLQVIDDQPAIHSTVSYTYNVNSTIAYSSYVMVITRNSRDGTAYVGTSCWTLYGTNLEYNSTGGGSYGTQYTSSLTQYGIATASGGYNSGDGFLVVIGPYIGPSPNVSVVNAVGTYLPDRNQSVQSIEYYNNNLYFFPGNGSNLQVKTSTGFYGVTLPKTDIFASVQTGSTIIGVPYNTGNLIVYSALTNNVTLYPIPVGTNGYNSVIQAGDSYYLLPSTSNVGTIVNPYGVNQGIWAASYFSPPEQVVSVSTYGNNVLLATSGNLYQVSQVGTYIPASSKLYTGSISSAYYDGRYVKVFGTGGTAIDTNPTVVPNQIIVSALVDTAYLNTKEVVQLQGQTLDYVFSQIQTTSMNVTRPGFYMTSFTGPVTEILMSNVVSAEMFLNGYSKGAMDSTYMQTLAPYWYYDRTPTSNVSVLPMEPYINMSRVREQAIFINASGPVSVYAKSLNVLRIKDGLGGLVFVARSR